jgi:hypothetical protein
MPLTPDDLRLLFDSTRTLYGNMREELETDDTYIRGEFDHAFLPDEWSDEGLEATIPGTAYNAVQNAADHLLTTPRIQVPARPMKDSREASQAQAESIRHFLDLWWDRIVQQNANPLRRAKVDLIRGRMVLKKTIRWDLLPDVPDDPSPSELRSWKNAVKRIGKRHFLWNLEVLPPATVMEDLEQPWDPTFVFETKKVRAHRLKALYGDTENGKRVLDGIEPMSELSYLECYTKPELDDPGKHVVWIADEVVLDESNPYSWEDADVGWRGYVPYLIADPGWGWGGVSETPRPEDRYVSIVRPTRSLVVAEARQLTSVEAWLRYYIFPLLIGENMPDVSDGTRDIEMGPGKIIGLKEGERLVPLSLGEAPVTVFQFLQVVLQRANDSTKFGALGGSAQRGVDTATEADLNIRNAATKLSGPSDALVRVATTINTQVLQDIEHILESPITIYGALSPGEGEVTIKPSELKGYHQTYVEMATSDDAALADRQARLHADLYRLLPGYSERTALTKAGIVDPQEEQDERLIENTINDPMMHQARLLMALGGMGEAGEVLQRLVLQALQPGGGQQPSGDGTNPATSDALTTVEGLNNPAEGVISAARTNALADQAEGQFQ